MLVTALHHSREAVTLTVLFRILITKLYELVHRGSEVHFFDLADMLFVPVVNRDGYDHVTSAFGTDGWEIASQKRKNMNDTEPCQ